MVKIYTNYQSALITRKMSFNLLLPTFKKRPLNPNRKERKKVVSLASNTDVKLIITVMHGLNVPIRSDIEKRASKIDSGIGGENFKVRSRPFNKSSLFRNLL